MNHLYLIGFMGTGKSTVAGILKNAGCPVISIDEQIAKQERLTVTEIISRYGESYFRDCETQMLKMLQNEKGIIVDCGGGIVLREENIALMREQGKVLLFTASPETIATRLSGDTVRPLLPDSETAIAAMLTERNKYYFAAADIIIDTDDRLPTEIAKEILAIQNKSCYNAKVAKK